MFDGLYIKRQARNLWNIEVTMGESKRSYFATTDTMILFLEEATKILTEKVRGKSETDDQTTATHQEE